MDNVILARDNNNTHFIIETSDFDATKIIVLKPATNDYII